MIGKASRLGADRLDKRLASKDQTWKCQHVFFGVFEVDPPQQAHIQYAKLFRKLAASQSYPDRIRHEKSKLRNLFVCGPHPSKGVVDFPSQRHPGHPQAGPNDCRSCTRREKNWPKTPDPCQFEGISLPLSLLEENGLVSFLAGWCTVHCQSLRNPDNVDQSLIPLVQAVEHLKDICFGRNGFIQPHYACPADKLEKLLTDHFGGTSVAELLPELRLEDGLFKLRPGNQNFSSLTSTYLWNKLRETLDPKEAFESWILCLRVNCDWAMPVLFDDDRYAQRTEFNSQLLAYLAQDTGLSYPMDTWWRQVISKDGFSNIVTPVITNVNLSIDAEGKCRSEHQDIELEKTTLATLSAAYTLPDGDDSSDLQFVQKWQRSVHWREPQLFYISLLASVIEANLHIDGQLLASHGFTEELLDLSKSRPILKHMLLNVLPTFESSNYKIFLLSQPGTCDIALFYLTKQSFFDSSRHGRSPSQHFDKGFQQLVCHEYLRAIEAESDSGDRLLKVVEFMGERCGLHTRDFAKTYEYQFLLCLLDSLSHQRVTLLGQAFSRHPAGLGKNSVFQSSQHFRYLLGFWLIERLENTGVDLTGTLSRSLKTTILSYYMTEFEENLAGKQRSLEPNVFFSALPWHKLIGQDGVSPLLALSNRCCDWLERLRHSNETSLSVSSVVRHYLQVLMCVGRPQRVPQYWERVANRVFEIVRTLGFGPREQATYLFDAAFYSNQYDLWPTFCSYTNLIQDSLYDDFVERCLSSIPLNQLFVLLERCTVIARVQKLQEAIATRQAIDIEDLELSGLEQAFISAWNSGNTDLVAKLMATAKDFLAQDRFAKTKNPHVLRGRKVWLSYEYKWQLQSLLNTLRDDPKEFAEAAHQVPIPHEHNSKSCHDDDRAQWQECERFRRYIIAAAYCATDAQKCVNIMEALYKDSQSDDHSFMLFKGRLAHHKITQDKSGLRHALSQFLDSLGDTDPEYMPTTWVATILDAYRQLQDSPEIDAFWMKLSPDQQARREVLHPYCRALMARGDALIAQQIIIRYRELNLQASEGIGITDLIDELGKVVPSERSMSQFVQVINEDSQRSTAQLAKHYSQIVSKEFEDYVAIVGQGLPPHEFLKNVVLEVANELLLRKKNLQIHSVNSSGKTNVQITQEDLINDWFTSLFDKRMAEARIGFKDQKRGGESASGKSPGEIDGYITDAKNKRLSIFEAFRLPYLNKTVISEHLNKIAGYDKESLSPVFIAAYCDVSDFSTLVRGYSEFIAIQDYTGFTVESEAGSSVETLHNTDHLWLGIERRRRNDREIIFYHLLLNMSFQSPRLPTSAPD